MKRVHIELLEQNFGNKDNKHKKPTYGLCVTFENKDGKEVSEMYIDVSYSKRKVEQFIDMIVRNEVSPVHIDEMIDDYFYSA